MARGKNKTTEDFKDEEKTNIALDNGFKILRIKYTEYYNLDEIIVKFIRRMEEVSDNGK